MAAPTPVRFHEVDWAELSPVQLRCEMAHLSLPESGLDARHAPEPRVLRIRFEGRCGVGSQGNGDAHCMRAMSRAAFDMLDPDGLVLDFSALTYEWGDMMSRVLDLPDAWRELDEPPFAIVVGPDCEAGMMSLLLQELQYDRSELGWVFHDTDAACAKVAAIVREQALSQLEPACDIHLRQA